MAFALPQKPVGTVLLAAVLLAGRCLPVGSRWPFFAIIFITPNPLKIKGPAMNRHSGRWVTDIREKLSV
jgi:hypothetical protein